MNCIEKAQTAERPCQRIEYCVHRTSECLIFNRIYSNAAIQRAEGTPLHAEMLQNMKMRDYERMRNYAKSNVGVYRSTAMRSPAEVEAAISSGWVSEHDSLWVFGIPRDALVRLTNDGLINRMKSANRLRSHGDSDSYSIEDIKRCLKGDFAAFFLDDVTEWLEGDFAELLDMKHWKSAKDVKQEFGISCGALRELSDQGRVRQKRESEVASGGALFYVPDVTELLNNKPQPTRR